MLKERSLSSSRTGAAALDTSATSILFWLSFILLFAALVFGGGTRQGLISDVIPQLLALPLLAFALPRAAPLLKRERWTCALLIGILGLPLLQTVPLPSSVWSILPGHQAITEIYNTAGIEAAWRPLSVVPGATLRAFFFLLPPVAVFLSVLSLDRDARQWLLLLAVTIGIISVPIAMLQVIGGEGSPLYFFDITNFGRGVGFFANANHFAAFQYAMLPFTACVLVEYRDRFKIPPLVLFVGLAAILLAGLSLTGSRSALLLGVLSAVLTGAFILRQEVAKIGRRRVLWVAAGLLFILVPFASGMGLLAILERFTKRDLLEDARWVIASNTWSIVRTYFPFGSGFGTFPDIYLLYERPQDVITPIVNRAHDDLLEVILEGGAASLCILLGLVAWLAVRTVKALRQDINGDVRQARAGFIVLWLFLLHSLWDYPMRTIAISVIAAICLALQFRPQAGTRNGQGRKRSSARQG